MKFLRRTLTLVLTLIIAFSCMLLTASAAENLVYGIGFVNTTSLRLRAQANTTSAVLATAPQNDCVVILSKIGEWYRVNYNLQEGYMHERYLDVAIKENAELGIGSVTGSRVNLRSGPATTYAIVTTASQGESCYIIGLNEGWYKVIYNGSLCYIRSDYLKLTEYPYENQQSPNSPKFFRRGVSTGTLPAASALTGSASSSSAKPSGSSISGNQIVGMAQKYLGCPYAAGGASPSGFDCSGFVYYVLNQLGYSAYRTPSDQYKMGTAVSKNDLQPGDLVFFSGTGGSGISHVGIYCGSGQFIHAPNSRSTVSYSDLTTGYWAEHYFGARRVHA